MTFTKFFITIALLFSLTSAQAQRTTPCADSACLGEVFSGGTAVAGYQGPADIVASPLVFWGLRAVSSTYALAHSKIANICTPSTGSNICGDVNSDSSGNLNLAGSTVSSCNNTTVICTVKTLYDQVGTACGATNCDVTQATEANRPILVVPGAANGCSNTANFCMHWTGTATTLTAPNSFSVQSQPYTIAHVYELPTRTGDMGLYSTTNTNSTILVGYGGANRVVIFAGVSTPFATATDAAWHSIQGIFNDTGTGTASNITVDGTSTVGSLGTTTGITGGQAIFGQFSGGDQFVGFMSECGIWLGAFTSGQATSMNSNAHVYWGF